MSSFHTFMTFYVLQDHSLVEVCLFLKQETETFVYNITQPIATTKQKLAKSLSFVLKNFHWRRIFEASNDDVCIVLLKRPKRKAKAVLSRQFSKILYLHTCERLSLTCLPLRWNPRLRHQPLIIYNQKSWQIQLHKEVRLLEMRYTKAFKVEPLAPWLWLFRYFKLNLVSPLTKNFKKFKGRNWILRIFSWKWKCLIFLSISWSILIQFFLSVRLHNVNFEYCFI